MQIRKAYRYELMPKGEHIRKMKQFCGCARFVFNRALAYQKAQYESDNTVKFSSCFRRSNISKNNKLF